MRSAILTLALAGCLPPAAMRSDQSSQLGGPTHAPATEAEWQANERAATALLGAMQVTETKPPVRVARRGHVADFVTRLEGGHCYSFGVAWNYALETLVSVGFEPAADGTRASDSFGARGQRLPSPGGVFELCADRAGPVRLSLTAITREGYVANDELLEYAIAIGRRPELESEALTRRTREAQEAERIRAEHAANEAAALEAEARAVVRARLEAAAEEVYRIERESRGEVAPEPPQDTGWSITVHNDCPRTVRLFIGRGTDPRFGSGTHTSLGSNTTTSYSGSGDDAIWIEDDGGNGLGSYLPSGRGGRVEIVESCTGFARR
jgi:hypothetical protein